MRNVLIPFLALAALACTSASRPSDIPEPEIGIRQPGPIFFGSSTSAPVSFEVLIRNSSRSIPLKVREIELTSMGSSQYALLPTRRRLGRTIQPGETVTIGLTATAVTRSGRSSPTERPSMRAVVMFETPDGDVFREIVMDHIVME